MGTFMFRAKEVKRIRNANQAGRSVLLVGIRRTGKSELMKEVLRQLAEDGQPVHYMDVADQTQLYAFYRDLLAAMPKSVMEHCLGLLKQAGSLPDTLMGWLRTHIDKVNLPGGLGGVDLNAPDEQARLLRYWETVVKALLQALEKAPKDSIPVFAIDELPFMLENLFARGVTPDEATVALASLRKLRDAGLRMIVGGSISLENLLTLHQIPHTVLGGLVREALPPFTRDEARAFLQDRLQGYPASAHIERVLDKLPDYVPHFLDEVVHHLKVLSPDDDVDLVMETQVLPAIRRSFLTQFQERLDKNYTPDEFASACKILDHLAKHGVEGTSVNLAAQPPNATRVLTKLQYDMFIEEAPDMGFRFTLQLLRQWWQRQRGLGPKKR